MARALSRLSAAPWRQSYVVSGTKPVLALHHSDRGGGSLAELVWSKYASSDVQVNSRHGH